MSDSTIGVGRKAKPFSYSQLKVLHVILGKADKNRANGVNQVIAGIAKYSSRHGAWVSVLGKAQTASCEGEVIAKDGFSVTVYTKKSRAFRRAVRQEVEASDIVHLHGTYSPLNIWVGKICDALGKPYVVTLHGGLSPARNAWRNCVQKRLFHWIFQKRHLERAALVQVLTEEESTEALAEFRPKRMRVIPNGIDLEEFPPLPVRVVKESEIRIGYIGRISREKNLDALCAAFTNVAEEYSARLLLAGPSSSESEAIARRYAESGVEFVGEKFGQEKLDFLDSIDLFVHPSKTDVFSIGAMEALAREVPVVISRTSDASHFAEFGAFIMCEPTAFGIERALRRALGRRDDWANMTRRGRHLIETRLNWDTAADEVLSAYQKVLEK